MTLIVLMTIQEVVGHHPLSVQIEFEAQNTFLLVCLSFVQAVSHIPCEEHLFSLMESLFVAYKIMYVA